MTTWINETLHHEFRSGFFAEKILVDKKTPFQHLIIIENRLFGRIMLIDNVVQTTEADEYIYHESISHLPIFFHGGIERVLIIGGGDGGTAEEVLKHTEIKHVTLVEIDSIIIEASRTYLKSICKDAFEDERLNLVIGNAKTYVENYYGPKYDLIIVDSSDPIGPAKELFSESFYIDCKKCLNNEGVLVTQNGVPFFQGKELSSTLKIFNNLFSDASCFIATIPTYVGGPMAFGWGTDNLDIRKTSSNRILNRFKNSKLKLKHYNTEWHNTAFALPEYIARLILD